MGDIDGSCLSDGVVKDQPCLPVDDDVGKAAARIHGSLRVRWRGGDGDPRVVPGVDLYGIAKHMLEMEREMTPVSTRPRNKLGFVA